MKRNFRLWLCAVTAGFSMLGGCANPTKDDTNPINIPEKTGENSILNCAVRLTQNGSELTYQMAGFARLYQLQSAPFRIEVSTEKCDASISTLKDIKDLMYVASNPYVVSPQGLGLASNPHDDVLIRRSIEVKLSPDDVRVFDAQKDEIHKLCEDFHHCPAQIFAFRNYWSFLVDSNATRGKVAEISKLTEKQTIDKAIGIVPIIVFTKAKMDQAEFRTGSDAIAILQNHPILLMFKGPGK